MNLRRLVPLYLAAMISPMGGIGIITLLPVLARSWNTNIQWISLTVTFYMIPYIVFQLFSGSIAHNFNTRKTLLFGFGVYSLGGIFSGFSTGLESLVAARFIQGLGAGFINPVVMALVGEMVEPQRLGMAMGLLGVTYTLGVTMGPLISGVLEVSLGWPWFFFFLAALGIFTGALYWLTGEETARPDWGPGKISDALVLVKKSYSFPDLRYVSFAAFFMFLGYFGLMTFVADHLKVTFSLPSDRIGFILSTSGFSGIVASVFAGILGDRYSRKLISSAGMGIMVLTIVGLQMMDYSYKNYILVFNLFGIGSAAAWASLNTLAVQAVPELRKPATSLYNAIKYAGYALAPLILSFLYTPFSISAVRWACIAFILVGLLLISQIRRETA